MTPQLPQAEITRIEAEANSKWPLDENVPPTKYTSSRNALMLDFRSAYVSGAQAEAVRGREMMAGVLNFAHEMDLELVLRDNGDHQWADFSTNPTTYYTAQQIADLYILDTQKRKG